MIRGQGQTPKTGDKRLYLKCPLDMFCVSDFMSDPVGIGPLDTLSHDKVMNCDEAKRWDLHVCLEL